MIRRGTIPAKKKEMKMANTSLQKLCFDPPFSVKK
jgi:hypothetical protein